MKDILILENMLKYPEPACIGIGMGCVTRFLRLEAGVRQGGVLSLFLFVICINSIAEMNEMHRLLKYFSKRRRYYFTFYYCSQSTSASKRV